MFWHAAMPIWVGGYEAGPLGSTLHGVVFAICVRRPRRIAVAGGRANFVTRNKLAVITRLVRNCAQGRVIQYSRDVSDESMSRGVLGPPPELVIGRRVRADPVAGDDDNA
jgi:hypothetical protein